MLTNQSMALVDWTCNSKAPAAKNIETKIVERQAVCHRHRMAPEKPALPTSVAEPAILPRFRFRFLVPIFLSTVPVPAPVPVPTLKFLVIFSIKTPAGYLDFCFFSRQLHACVGQYPVRVDLI
jgi:hypothetical protein